MGGFFGSSKGMSMPTPTAAPEPVVNQDLVDRQAADLARRRRGTAATVTGAADIGTTSGSVAAKTLLGQ